MMLTITTSDTSPTTKTNRTIYKEDMKMAYTYDRNGNRTGYIDASGNRYDNCGNYKGHTDRSSGYTYDSNGNRTGWHDRNSGYSYNNSGNRTGWHDRNTGYSYDNSGNYRGRRSKY